MNVDAELIDRIVNGVMQRLASPADALRSATTTKDEQPVNKQSSQAPLAAELDEDVITAEQLELRSGGAKRITIGPRSILTPSARDYLNNRNIEWSRRPAIAAATSRWQAIVLQSTPAITAAVEDVDRTSGKCWQRELVGSADEAVAIAVAALCRGDTNGTVVFATDVEAIVCRANRTRQVRAATVRNVECVASVRRQMGANLIGINPAEKSYFELRNMLRAFTAHGPPSVPEWWSE